MTICSFSQRWLGGIALCTFLLSTAVSAHAQEPVFQVPSDPSVPVISYSETPEMLGDPDRMPRVQVFGDGLVWVHYPVYMKKAGDYQMQLNPGQLRKLLNEVTPSIDFDELSVGQTPRPLLPKQILKPLPVHGQDKHDIKELEPFSDPHLSVVFPHEEWGETTWGYASDYHEATHKPEGEWVFAVRGSENFSDVTLTLDGPAEILRKGKLRDLESGKIVKLKNGSANFAMTSDIHYFSFRIGKK